MVAEKVILHADREKRLPLTIDVAEFIRAVDRHECPQPVKTVSVWRGSG
jgi:hypothetical protein